MGTQKYADPQGDWLTVAYYAGSLAAGKAVPDVVAACGDQQVVSKIVALTGKAVIRWHVVQPPMVFNFDPVTTMQPAVSGPSRDIFDTALFSKPSWICSNSTYPNSPGLGLPLRGSGTLEVNMVSLASVLVPAHPALTPEERSAWALDPTLSAATNEKLALVQPAFTGPRAALCPSMASEDVGPWRLSFFARPPFELRVPKHGPRPAYVAYCNPVNAAKGV